MELIGSSFGGPQRVSSFAFSVHSSSISQIFRKNKTTLHGGESRSISGLLNRGRGGRERKSGNPPPRSRPHADPTVLYCTILYKKYNTGRVLFNKNNKKNGWPERASRDNMYAGLSPSRARPGFLWLVDQANYNSVASQILRLCVRKQLSRSRCLFLLLILTMSSRVYLFFPPRDHNLRPPTVTVSTHTSASNAVAFQSPAMQYARVSLCTQSVHSFSFPPRPLRAAPSR